jgi:type I restriction enzyme S subunit
MMEEWKEYKLGELSIGKGSYGIGASAVPYSPSLHTYLRITDINDDGTLNKNGLMSLDDENADDYILQPNDIVFARTGNSTGRSYFYDGSDGKLVYAGFLIKFSLDSKKVNPRILKYYTHSKPYFDWVRSFDTGGTRGNINAKTYGDMPIVLPPRNLQDKIVSILKSLDDKIEVNRKINENLEQQAQALFKSWFVDFEPFKNGEFVESELGMIPKGWRVGMLEEIGDIVGGSTPSKSKPEYYTDKGIAWLTPKDLSISNNKFTSKGEIDITEEGYKSCSTKLMPKGSVLFSSRAPIGYITIAKNDICTNQGFKSVVPRLAGTAFIYYFLKISTKDIENKATGSTFKEASGALMKSLQLIIAPERILHDFENIMKPLFTQQEVLEDESRRLAELRDTLLPKLMSGELKVGDVTL